MQERPEFGRKVFFLNPSYNFKTSILPVLSDMEYELYVIEDYRQAKNILRAFPDSICFVCIDTVLPVEQWFNFIASFTEDPVLSSIFLGVISAHARKSERDYFLLKAVLPAGFISLFSAKQAVIELLRDILELNGAKGSRKYVTVHCSNDKLVTGLCVIETVNCFLKIHTLSSIGAQCTVPAAVTNFFPLNLLIQNLIIRLRHKIIKCNAIVIHSQLQDHEVKITLLFTQGMPYMAKKQIREYVRLFLQEKIDALAAENPADTADYSKLQKSVAEEAFLIEADNDEAPPEGEIQYAEEA